MTNPWIQRYAIFRFTYIVVGVGIHLGSEKQHDYLFFCSCPLVLCVSNPNQACCRNMERSVIESYQVWHCMKSLFRGQAYHGRLSGSRQLTLEPLLRSPTNAILKLAGTAAAGSIQPGQCSTWGCKQQVFIPFPQQRFLGEWWALEFRLFLDSCVGPLLYLHW